MEKKLIIVLCLCIFSSRVISQEQNDSIIYQAQDSATQFSPKQLIVPTSLIVLGSLGLVSEPVKAWNNNIKQELALHRSYRIHLDDYIQYLPVVSYYGLSLAGAKPKYDYVDRTFILATSYVSMGIMVNAFKLMINSPRPDMSQRNSFPSGHTAKAFMGAELVRREYWDDSPWYGIAAYTVATTVGVLRVYNERHWVTDVLAGAGFGILSAQIGYWMLPFNRQLFGYNRTESIRTVVTPYYTGQQGGLSLLYRF